MFFPISDDNPSSSVPYLTYLLIGICTFVFVLQYLSQMNPLIYYNFGFIPANFFSDYSSFTIYTSMFLHGGFFHGAERSLHVPISKNGNKQRDQIVPFVLSPQQVKYQEMSVAWFDYRRGLCVANSAAKGINEKMSINA